MRLSHTASVLIAAVFASALVGCSTVKGLFGKGDSKDVDGAVAESAESAEPKPSGGAVAKASRQDENELKMARLWARVDELEEQTLTSKERIRVLEKGMTLGLVPEELRKSNGRGGSNAKAAAPIVKESLKDTSSEGSESEESAVEPQHKKSTGDAKTGDAEKVAPKHDANAMTPEESESYQAAFASAHDFYRAGRYGLAIAEFDKLGKTYGSKIPGGVHKYWIGKAWMGLKEFNTARQTFVEFISENASSPWLPRAKLELGRVEWGLGLRESAIARFREITQAYPYEDAAEMAKMELENLGKSL